MGSMLVSPGVPLGVPEGSLIVVHCKGPWLESPTVLFFLFCFLWSMIRVPILWALIGVPEQGLNPGPSTHQAGILDHKTMISMITK